MRNDLERINDIIEAIEQIEKNTSKGKTVFDNDEMIQVWVIHHLRPQASAPVGATPGARWR
mgnify:CR=1 FL=1